jgi:hypothetical protein
MISLSVLTLGIPRNGRSPSKFLPITTRHPPSRSNCAQVESRGGCGRRSSYAPIDTSRSRRIRATIIAPGSKETFEWTGRCPVVVIKLLRSGPTIAPRHSRGQDQKRSPLVSAATRRRRVRRPACGGLAFDPVHTKLTEGIGDQERQPSRPGSHIDDQRIALQPDYAQICHHAAIQPSAEAAGDSVVHSRVVGPQDDELARARDYCFVERSIEPTSTTRSALSRGGVGLSFP